MNEELFLRGLFRDYYSKNRLESVPSIDKREFGIGEFGKKISSRHLSFRSTLEFNDFLVRNTPFFVSFSCAYYSFPAAKPMEAKELLSADLVYEFDADDIPTDCKQEHDSWSCTCGAKGKGSISNCTSCSKPVKAEQWVCPQCIGETKKQMFGLVSLLEKELGITDGLFFNFSGSKGFHVHVRKEELQKISGSGRVELVDYLTGFSLDPQMHGFFYSGKKFLCPKKEQAVGWSQRLHLRMKSFFEADAEEFSLKAGVSFSKAQKILGEKEKFLREIDSGKLLQFSGVKPGKFWGALVASAVDAEKLSLDRSTSIDIRKILRVPDSLHGSTGLKASSLDFDKLKDFSPLDSAVVFSQKPIKLKSVNAPKFYLGGQWWGPFKEEQVQLPEFVAVYLLCRGNAALDN